MKKHNLYALVAAGLLAGGMSITSASAADLGGTCCADLEERIAELEATTARKGNRKVSLTVSGWVGQQVTFWDDGVESNTYVHDLGTTLGSHVKFTGSAQISPGWSAGYVLQIEAISNDGLQINQANPNTSALYNTLSGDNVAGQGGTQVLQSYWFVKSDSLGKVSLGRQSQASDNTAILVDGSGSLVPANWVAFDTNSFAIRLGNGALTELSWGNAQSCFGMGGAWGDCNGLTQNVVRYDSPTFAGFSLSASWGDDDMWDIAARYAGEHHGFKLAAAAAYNEVNNIDYNNLNSALGVAVPDMEYFQLGVYVQHVATGLFGLYNYGTLEIDEPGGLDDVDTHYFKGGLRTKFNHLGATIFYGEYLRGNDGAVGTEIDNGVPGTDTITSSELDVWGLGVVQEIDAAAMSVWIKYRNLSLDVGSEEGEIAESGGFEDFNYVGVGGLINF
jgi:predicted porin